MVAVPSFKSVAVAPFIEATDGSEETNDHAPVDVDVGGCRTRMEDDERSALTSGKAPSVGSGPCTVSVIFAIEGPKSPTAFCEAVMTLVPKARGVTTQDALFDTTEATLGFDDVKVHHADEVDVGGESVKLAIPPFVIVMSPKVPSTGAIATTSNLICAIADFQFGVLRWLA